ncbi:alpha/beta fold hydrolase [Hahella sp. KA22]|nr:alpha/beta fold hydrolase [Hahella sp. KA22]
MVDASTLQALLIVVIEGDGLPWSRPWRISSDPTSPDPLMFDWYRQWPGEALYIGRPCYFGARSGRVPPAPWDRENPPEAQPCFAYWYTHGRYSEAVVAAMAQALRMKAGDRPLLLLGHSGGGTLAMLLAAQMSNVAAVMTLSGNLDVGAWTSEHNFSRLTGSLDPAVMPPLNRDVRQWHWGASEDRTVKPEWIEREATRQQATFQLGPAAKHSDWRLYWPQINDAVSQLKATISRQR